jgi:hypothetical protein
MTVILAFFFAMMGLWPNAGSIGVSRQSYGKRLRPVVASQAREIA